MSGDRASLTDGLAVPAYANPNAMTLQFCTKQLAIGHRQEKRRKALQRCGAAETLHCVFGSGVAAL